MLKGKIINPIFWILLMGCILAQVFFNLSLAFSLIVVCCWLIITTIGSFCIGLNYHLQAKNKLISSDRIALTFDDGPHPQFTPQILDLLKTYKVKATFFCIGKNLKKYPELAQRIVDEGHSLGNHSYTHSYFFSFYPTKKIKTELDLTSQLIALYTNNNEIFRPPYGVTNPAIARASTTYKVIGWDVRSLDTVIKNPSKISARIIKRLNPGSIVLMHDTHKQTLPALENVLRYLKKNNIQTARL